MNAHGGGDLRGVKLRVWFIAGIGRALRAALIEIHLTADAPPAFTKHSIGGKLRAGEQGSADTAAITGKGKLGQNIAEWVVVEIYLVERSGITVLDDPLAIVKRQTFTNTDNTKRTIEV